MTVSTRRLLTGAAMLLVVAGAAYATGTTEQAADSIRLRIMMPNGSGVPFPGNADMNDNEWANIYADAFPEYEFLWEILPQDGYSEKKNLAMASGDMPDIIGGVGLPDVVKWSEQEIILPLDEVVEQHIPLWDQWVVANGSHSGGRYNGKQWLFTAPSNTKENGVMSFIRQDWLDNLGLEMPRTTDELLKVMKAFTFNDPDGNGKQDTWGMGGEKQVTNGLGRMSYIFNPHGATEFDEWWTLDGQIVPVGIMPGMKDALAFIKRANDAGVIDPDTFVQGLGDYAGKVRAGAYGVIDFWSNGVINVFLPAMKELDPSVDIRLFDPPLRGPKGHRIVQTRPPAPGQTYAAPITNEHPEAFARVFNWLLEGNANTFNYGTIEGTSYHQVGEYQVEIGRQSDPDWALRTPYRIMWGHGQMYPGQKMVDRWQAIVAAGRTTADFPRQIALQGEYGVFNQYLVPSPLVIEKWADLKTRFDEVKVDIVLGNAPLGAFDEWVEFFWANGGRELVDEVTRLNQ